MSASPSALTALYPALAALPEPLRSVCLGELRAVPVAAGTVLFDAGQPCTGFPLVLEGAIRVFKRSGSGRELPLYRVLPGESCLVSSGCLLGKAAYNACGIAERDTVLALLPRSRFEALLVDAGFRQYVFELFADRIADLMQLVEEVAFRKLDQRLAALLLGKGRVVQLTHQQLADELGSVREMVSRLLKGFAEQGWVRLGREQIEILDPAALRGLCA